MESIKVTFVFLCPAVLIYIFTFKCSQGNGRSWHSSVQRLQSGNSFHMSNQVSSILDILLLSFWGNWLWGSFFLIYARLSHMAIGPMDYDEVAHREGQLTLVRTWRVSPTFLVGVNSPRTKQNISLHKAKPVCPTFKTPLLKGNNSFSSLGNTLFTIQEGFTLTDKISY